MTTQILTQTTTTNKTFSLPTNTLWIAAASMALLSALLVNLALGIVLMTALSAAKIYFELQSLSTLQFELELDENLMAELTEELIGRND